MVAPIQTAQRNELDSKKRSSRACNFEGALQENIVGQEEAVQALVDLYFSQGFLASDWTVAYLIKPFSGEELLDAVDATLKWKPNN